MFLWQRRDRSNWQANDGGTEYVLYRKDKVTFKKGKELLLDYRIEGEAFTKRTVASCCNSAMYLEYEKGH